jgi:hypothetical protein
MSGWDDYVACLDGKGTQAAQVARGLALTAFHDATDMAEAFCVAVVDWWNSLDPRVQKAITWATTLAAGTGGILFTKLAGLLVTESGVGLLAQAGVEVAAGLLALAAGFTIGAFVVASADCLDLISLD